MAHLLGHKRKFDGEKYKATHVKKFKSHAENLAKLLRRKGMKARIIKAKCEKGGNEYYVFTKK